MSNNGPKSFPSIDHIKLLFKDKSQKGPDIYTEQNGEFERTLHVGDLWSTTTENFSGNGQVIGNINLQELWDIDPHIQWNNKTKELKFIDPSLMEYYSPDCEIPGSDEVTLAELTGDLEVLSQWDRVNQFGKIYDIQFRKIDHGRFKYSNARICSNIASSLGYFSLDKLINDEITRKEKTNELYEKYRGTDCENDFPRYDGWLDDPEYIQNGWIDIDKIIQSSLSDDNAYDNEASLSVRTKRIRDRKRALVNLLVNYSSDIHSLNGNNKLSEFGLRIVDKSSGQVLDEVGTLNDTNKEMSNTLVANYVGSLQNVTDPIDNEQRVVCDPCGKIEVDNTCEPKQYVKVSECESTTPEDGDIHEIAAQFKINHFDEFRQFKTDFANTIDPIKWTTGTQNFTEKDFPGISSLRSEFGNDTLTSNHLNVSRGFAYGSGDADDGYATGGFFHDKINYQAFWPDKKDVPGGDIFFWGHADDPHAKKEWSTHENKILEFPLDCEYDGNPYPCPNTELWNGTEWSVITDGPSVPRAMGLAGGNTECGVTVFGTRALWDAAGPNFIQDTEIPFGFIDGIGLNPFEGDPVPVDFSVTAETCEVYKFFNGTWERIGSYTSPNVARHSVAGKINSTCDVYDGDGTSIKDGTTIRGESTTMDPIMVSAFKSFERDGGKRSSGKTNNNLKSLFKTTVVSASAAFELSTTASSASNGVSNDDSPSLDLLGEMLVDANKVIGNKGGNLSTSKIDLDPNLETRQYSVNGWRNPVSLPDGQMFFEDTTNETSEKDNGYYEYFKFSGFAFNGTKGDFSLDEVNEVNLDDTFEKGSGVKVTHVVPIKISENEYRKEEFTFEDALWVVDTSLKYPVKSVGTSYTGTETSGLATGGKITNTLFGCVKPNAADNIKLGYFEDSSYDEFDNSIVNFSYKLNGSSWTRVDNLPESVAYHASVGDADWAMIFGGIHGSVEVNDVYASFPGCDDWKNTIARFGGSTFSRGTKGLDGEVRYASFATRYEDEYGNLYFKYGDPDDISGNGIIYSQDYIDTTLPTKLYNDPYAQLIESTSQKKIVSFGLGDIPNGEGLYGGYVSYDRVIADFTGHVNIVTYASKEKSDDNLLDMSIFTGGESWSSNAITIDPLSLDSSGEPISALPFAELCANTENDEVGQWVKSIISGGVFDASGSIDGGLAPRYSFLSQSANEHLWKYSGHPVDGGIWIWSRPTVGENFFHPENFKKNNGGTFEDLGINNNFADWNSLGIESCKIGYDELSGAYESGYISWWTQNRIISGGEDQPSSISESDITVITQDLSGNYTIATSGVWTYYDPNVENCDTRDLLSLASIACPESESISADPFSGVGLVGSVKPKNFTYSFYVTKEGGGLDQFFWGRRRDTFVERWRYPQVQNIIDVFNYKNNQDPSDEIPWIQVDTTSVSGWEKLTESEVFKWGTLCVGEFETPNVEVSSLGDGVYENPVYGVIEDIIKVQSPGAEVEGLEKFRGWSNHPIQTQDSDIVHYYPMTYDAFDGPNNGCRSNWIRQKYINEQGSKFYVDPFTNGRVFVEEDALEPNLVTITIDYDPSTATLDVSGLGTQFVEFRAWGAGGSATSADCGFDDIFAPGGGGGFVRKLYSVEYLEGGEIQTQVATLNGTSLVSLDGSPLIRAYSGEDGSPSCSGPTAGAGGSGDIVDNQTYINISNEYGDIIESGTTSTQGGQPYTDPFTSLEVIPSSDQLSSTLRTIRINGTGLGSIDFSKLDPDKYVEVLVWGSGGNGSTGTCSSAGGGGGGMARSVYKVSDISGSETIRVDSGGSQNKSYFGADEKLVGFSGKGGVAGGVFWSGNGPGIGGPADVNITYSGTYPLSASDFYTAVTGLSNLDDQEISGGNSSQSSSCTSNNTPGGNAGGYPTYGGGRGDFSTENCTSYNTSPGAGGRAWNVYDPYSSCNGYAETGKPGEIWIRFVHTQTQSGYDGIETSDISLSSYVDSDVLLGGNEWKGGDAGGITFGGGEGGYGVNEPPQLPGGGSGYKEGDTLTTGANGRVVIRFVAEQNSTYDFNYTGTYSISAEPISIQELVDGGSSFRINDEHESSSIRDRAALWPWCDLLEGNASNKATPGKATWNWDRFGHIWVAETVSRDWVDYNSSNIDPLGRTSNKSKWYPTEGFWRETYRIRRFDQKGNELFRYNVTYDEAAGPDEKVLTVDRGVDFFDDINVIREELRALDGELEKKYVSYKWDVFGSGIKDRSIELNKWNSTVLSGPTQDWIESGLQDNDRGIQMTGWQRRVIGNDYISGQTSCLSGITEETYPWRHDTICGMISSGYQKLVHGEQGLGSHCSTTSDNDIWIWSVPLEESITSSTTGRNFFKENSPYVRWSVLSGNMTGMGLVEKVWDTEPVSATGIVGYEDPWKEVEVQCMSGIPDGKGSQFVMTNNFGSGSMRYSRAVISGPLSYGIGGFNLGISKGIFSDTNVITGSGDIVIPSQDYMNSAWPWNIIGPNGHHGTRGFTDMLDSNGDYWIAVGDRQNKERTEVQDSESWKNSYFIAKVPKENISNTVLAQTNYDKILDMNEKIELLNVSREFTIDDIENLVELRSREGMFELVHTTEGESIFDIFVKLYEENVPNISGGSTEEQEWYNHISGSSYELPGYTGVIPTVDLVYELESATKVDPTCIGCGICEDGSPFLSEISGGTPWIQHNHDQWIAPFLDSPFAGPYSVDGFNVWPTAGDHNKARWGTQLWSSVQEGKSWLSYRKMRIHPDPYRGKVALQIITGSISIDDFENGNDTKVPCFCTYDEFLYDWDDYKNSSVLQEIVQLDTNLNECEDNIVVSVPAESEIGVLEAFNDDIDSDRFKDIVWDTCTTETTEEVIGFVNPREYTSNYYVNPFTGQKTFLKVGETNPRFRVLRFGSNGSGSIDLSNIDPEKYIDFQLWGSGGNSNTSYCLWWNTAAAGGGGGFSRKVYQVGDINEFGNTISFSIGNTSVSYGSNTLLSASSGGDGDSGCFGPGGGSGGSGNISESKTYSLLGPGSIDADSPVYNYNNFGFSDLTASGGSGSDMVTPALWDTNGGNAGGRNFLSTVYGLSNAGRGGTPTNAQAPGGGGATSSVNGSSNGQGGWLIIGFVHTDTESGVGYDGITVDEINSYSDSNVSTLIDVPLEVITTTRTENDGAIIEIITNRVCKKVYVCDLNEDESYVEWATSFVQEYKDRTTSTRNGEDSDKYFYKFDARNTWDSNTYRDNPNLATVSIVPYDWRRWQDGTGMGGDTPYLNVLDASKFKCNTLQEYYVGQIAFGTPSKAVVAGGFAIGGDTLLSSSNTMFEKNTTRTTFKWNLLVNSPEDYLNKNYQHRSLSPFFSNEENSVVPSTMGVVIYDVSRDVLVERQGSVNFTNENRTTVRFSETGDDIPDFVENNDKYSIMLTPDRNVKVWWENKTEQGFDIVVEMESWSGNVDWQIILVDTVDPDKIDNEQNFDEQDTFDKFEDK